MLIGPDDKEVQRMTEYFKMTALAGPWATVTFPEWLDICERAEKDSAEFREEQKKHRERFPYDRMPTDQERELLNLRFGLDHNYTWHGRSEAPTLLSRAELAGQWRVPISRVTFVERSAMQIMLRSPYFRRSLRSYAEYGSLLPGTPLWSSLFGIAGWEAFDATITRPRKGSRKQIVAHLAAIKRRHGRPVFAISLSGRPHSWPATYLAVPRVSGDTTSHRQFMRRVVYRSKILPTAPIISSIQVP